jgi:hypothetical protein
MHLAAALFSTRLSVVADLDLTVPFPLPSPPAASGQPCRPHSLVVGFFTSVSSFSKTLVSEGVREVTTLSGKFLYKEIHEVSGKGRRVSSIDTSTLLTRFAHDACFSEQFIFIAHCTLELSNLISQAILRDMIFLFEVRMCI